MENLSMRPKVVLKGARSLTTSTLDLYRKKETKEQWRHHRLKKLLGDSVDAGLDSYKDEHEATYFEDLQSLHDYKDVYSSVDSLATNDQVFSNDDAVNATSHMVAAPAQERSNSPSDNNVDKNRHSSTDSALEQLNRLEEQLMSTKCEMAKLMNRETCFKDILEKRESIILTLDTELEDLQRHRQQTQKSFSVGKVLQEEVRQLHNQNHFLNEEVRKLSQLRQRERNTFTHQYQQVQGMEGEVDQWKRDYVALLQSTITVPTGDVIDGMAVNLFGGNVHKERVWHLLEEARVRNPSLPTFERLANSQVHIDNFGFKHTHGTEGLLLHYICQQLSLHYQTRLASYERDQQSWKTILRTSGKSLHKTKEIKQLCRRGIPAQYRQEVWRRLVHVQVKDVMDDKGPHYYSHLVNMAYDSQYAGKYRKQITLDLLRTMPNNINFSTRDSEGILRMKEVLQAFCMHNPDVGYCQGLNFIVGMCLLFMDTEDTFWMLVAITEKHFASNYFDASLTGAQADQEVLKDIMKAKLPDLYAHLKDIDIELSTITLNWFLAIFFEVVPFQTLLRIWDCFLVEGPKVLFRLALALLKLNQPCLLYKKDTINVMRHLKCCGKIMFDVNRLIKTAFEDLKPFPRRKDIAAKQVVYLNSLKERLKKREAWRKAQEDKNKGFEELDVIPPSALAYECAALCGKGLLWLCAGGQNTSKVVLVNCEEALVSDLQINVDSHIMCACSLEDEIFLCGTLSRHLLAYSINNRHELWCVPLNDSVFSLCVTVDRQRNRLFAGMGDGTVAILEQIQPKVPQVVPFYIPVGRCPVTCILMVGSQVWVACGSHIHVLHADSLDVVEKICVSDNPFDNILLLELGCHGVWTIIKGSATLELWDTHTYTCRLLFDVKSNKVIGHKKEEDGSLNRSRITTLLSFDDNLWVGTGDGTLYTYDIVETKSHASPARATSVRSSSKTRSSSKSKDGQGPKESESSSRRSSSKDELRSKDKGRSSRSSKEKGRRDSVERDKDRNQEKSRKTGLDDGSSGRHRESRRSGRSHKERSKVNPDPDVNGAAVAGSDSVSKDQEVFPSSEKTKTHGDGGPGETSEESIPHHGPGTEEPTRSQESTACAGPGTEGPGSQEDTDGKAEHKDNSSKKRERKGKTFQAFKERIQKQRVIASLRSLNLPVPGRSADGVRSGADGAVNGLTGHTSSDSSDMVSPPEVAGADEPNNNADLEEKDFNMNLMEMPDVLKQTPSKGGAPPQETFITPKPLTSKMDPFESTSPSYLHEQGASVRLTNDSGNADDCVFTFDHLQNGDSAGNGKTGNRTSRSLPSSLGIFREKVLSGSPVNIPNIEVVQCQENGKKNAGLANCVDMFAEGTVPPGILQVGMNGAASQGGSPQGLSPVRDSSSNRTSSRSRSRLRHGDAVDRSPSDGALSSSSFSDLSYHYDLKLLAKIKICDRPVKGLVRTRCQGKYVIISCAGCYGDDEAVLKWTKVPGERIWTNQPMLEVCPVTNTPRTPKYMNGMEPQRPYSA